MPFKVNVTYSVARECITVFAIEEEHNCTGVQLVERSSSSRQDSLQRVLPTTITISKATTPAMIQDAVVHKHGVYIGYEEAKKQRNWLAAMINNLRQLSLRNFRTMPTWKQLRY